MSKKKLAKKLALNLLIIFINVFAFSKAFMGIKISLNNVWEGVLGLVVILFNIGLFVVVNTDIAKLQKVQKIVRPGSDIKTLDSCYNEISNYCNKNMPSAFENTLGSITTQIERFKKKKFTVGRILSEKFDVNEMTYHKYNNTVESIEKLFQVNIEMAIAKIKSFDEADIASTQKEIFQEYNMFILKAAADNEEIILKLDRLILELSKLKNMRNEDIESMDIIKEMEQLIINTKLYKPGKD